MLTVHLGGSVEGVPVALDGLPTSFSVMVCNPCADAATVQLRRHGLEEHEAKALRAVREGIDG